MRYPPGTTRKTFRFVPSRHRQDAVQQAWVAHLSGHCPIRAAEAFRIRQIRYESRYVLRQDWLMFAAPEKGGG